MNRKLRNTILAFSVTGTVLAVGLFAARPAVPGPSAAPSPATAASPACTPATGRGDALAERAGASADAGRAGPVAAGAAVVLAGLEATEAAEAEVEARRSRHVRRAVAVPYFSFARGPGRDSRS